MTESLTSCTLLLDIWDTIFGLLPTRQAMYCMYNVIWIYVHVTIVAVEKHYVFNILSESVDLFTENAKRCALLYCSLCPITKIRSV